MLKSQRNLVLKPYVKSRYFELGLGKFAYKKHTLTQAQAYINILVKWNRSEKNNLEYIAQSNNNLPK